MEKPEPRKEWAFKALEKLSKEFREKGSAVVGLSWVLINRLRSFVDVLSEDIRPSLSVRKNGHFIYPAACGRPQKSMNLLYNWVARLE